jgi:hypothetical protein
MSHSIDQPQRSRAANKYDGMAMKDVSKSKVTQF